MKKLLVVLALALTVALVGAACGGGDSDDDDSSSDTTEAPSDDGDDGEEAVSGDADAGEEVFAATCSSCHGADAEGIDGLGKTLAPSDYIADTPFDEIVIVVTDGRSVDDPDNTTGILMPPKGGNPALTDEDIDDVVAYLKSLN